MNTRITVLLLTLISGTALGLDSTDTAKPEPRPVTHIVAAPRATIIQARPQVPTFAPVPGWGDADNFPRRLPLLEARTGSTLRFALSKHSEGVWYTGGQGTLGTLLVLQWCPFLSSGSATDAKPATADPGQVPDWWWVTIGFDGARQYRRGPSVGRAEGVGVDFEVPLPGIYHLRALVLTYALPQLLRPSDDPRLPAAPAFGSALMPPAPQPERAHDFDVIPITVIAGKRAADPNEDGPQGSVLPEATTLPEALAGELTGEARMIPDLIEE